MKNWRDLTRKDELREKKKRSLDSLGFSVSTTTPKCRVTLNICFSWFSSTFEQRSFNPEIVNRADRRVISQLLPIEEFYSKRERERELNIKNIKNSTEEKVRVSSSVYFCQTFVTHERMTKRPVICPPFLKEKKKRNSEEIARIFLEKRNNLFLTQSILRPFLYRHDIRWKYSRYVRLSGHKTRIDVYKLCKYRYIYK